MSEVTDKQILDFLEAKLAKMQKVFKGYSSISVDSSGFAGRIGKMEFKAYNEHIGHSDKFDTADEAINFLIEPTRDRAKECRESAARLLAQAEAIEAGGAK